ncbi:MAG TPA: hypothetical protein VM434_18555 [Beijerinckiaceae bacterium]|nr:hypothetical protein [Beijerinckiaceae bacterium]
MTITPAQLRSDADELQKMAQEARTLGQYIRDSIGLADCHNVSLERAAVLERAAEVLREKAGEAKR